MAVRDQRLLLVAGVGVSAIPALSPVDLGIPALWREPDAGRGAGGHPQLPDLGLSLSGHLPGSGQFPVCLRAAGADVRVRPRNEGGGPARGMAAGAAAVLLP